MNRSAFQKSIAWNNVGEVAVVTGSKMPSVYHSAFLQFLTVRQRVLTFPFPLNLAAVA